jgi:hypothetical protein
MPETASKKITVDLCPKKPNKLVMDVGETRVMVEVAVTAKEKPAPIVIDRLIDKAARPVLDRYQKVVQEEVNRLQAKFLDMVKKRNTKGAAEMAKETSLSVRNACAALQAAVTDAVKAQIKADYRSDQNLLEAQVKVGLQIGFKVISIGKDVATLAVTAGADITAWRGLAKNIYDLATIINDQTKDEEARRNDLFKVFGEYTTDKQRRMIEVDKAVKSKKAKIELALKDLYRTLQPKSSKVEEKRKHYKAKCTSMRQGLEKLSKQADNMEKAMKAAPSLKEGVKLGAQMVRLKGNVKTTYISLQKAEKFSDDMSFLLTEAGVKVDDRVLKERLRDIGTLVEIVGYCKNLKDAAKELQDVVGTIAAAA